MTADWFAHLARHSAAAADFLARSDPSTARRFTEAAVAASRLAVELARQERTTQVYAGLADIKAALNTGPEIG